MPPALAPDRARVAYWERMVLNFSTETHIRVGPEAFFAAFADPARWQGQLTGWVSVEPLTSGDFGVGTRWRETRRMYGRNASEVFEVTAWDPPRVVELYVDGRQGTTGKGGYRFRYEVAPRDGGTDVQLNGEMLLSGWFSRMLGRLMLGTFRKLCARDLASLKAFLESADT